MGSITDELNSLLNTKGNNIAEAIQEFRNGQGGVMPGTDIELVTKTETIELLSSEESGGE